MTSTNPQADVSLHHVVVASADCRNLPLKKHFPLRTFILLSTFGFLAFFQPSCKRTHTRIRTQTPRTRTRMHMHALTHACSSFFGILFCGSEAHCIHTGNSNTNACNLCWFLYFVSSMSKNLGSSCPRLHQHQLHCYFFCFCNAQGV